MNLSNLSFFDLASDRMTWLAARQKVTSENVANANTPGYEAKDVAAFDTMVDENRGGSVRMAVTHPAHLQSGGGTAPGVREITDPEARAQTIDGNSVVLEDQAIRSAENADNYRMAAQLYRKGYELLSAAIGNN